MKLITHLIFLAAISIPTLSNAQAPKPVKEFGIGTTNFKDFSLEHRWGNEKKLNRIRGSFWGTGHIIETHKFSSQNSPDYSSKIKGLPLNISLGLEYSILKLKNLNERVGLFYGTAFGLNSSHYNNGNGNSSTDTNYNKNEQIYTLFSIGPKFSIPLGVFFKINNSLFLYGEISPNVSINYVYSKNISKVSDRNGVLLSKSENKSKRFDFEVSGISNGIALISLVYRK